jgi:hypothetical protein
MNERSASRGPNWALLLLIPAVAIIAKGARRRRAMWASSWGALGYAGHGYRHHGAAFAGTESDADPRAAFRLPPKIEWMLDSWHTRAHETLESSDPTDAPASTEAPTPPKSTTT